MKMKHFKNLFLIALALNLVSCSDDDDSNGNSNGNENFNNSDVTALADAATNSTWRITQFVDDGEEETSDFDGVTFTFNSNGTIDVEDGTDTFSGTWSVELDDSDFDDDDDLDELEFELSFSLSNDLDDLSEDWYVIEYSTSQIRLREDDDDADDLLTFEIVQ